jgi:hypothetical protein
MNAKTIRIKGLPAVVLAVGLVAFAGFRFLRAQTTLDDDGADVLRQWVTAEYVRYHLDRTDLTDEERAVFLLAADTVDVASLTARGRPDRTLVRLTVVPGTAHPPGTPTVRYYQMHYSTVTGWHLDRERTALSYYLAF